MKHQVKTWKVDGSKQVHYIKSPAIGEAERAVAKQIGNIGIYVTETISVEYDEADREKHKMTNIEYYVNDRILVTK